MSYLIYLRRFRRAKGLTQIEVAQRMGHKDSSLISRWEHGFSLPDLKNAFTLAELYGVTVDELFVDLREEMDRNP